MPFTRKYLYIFGGFSYYCETACYDLWQYEIPYVPLNTPPEGKWVNSGNHWYMLQDDVE